MFIPGRDIYFTPTANFNNYPPTGHDHKYHPANHHNNMTMRRRKKTRGGETNMKRDEFQEND